MLQDEGIRGKSRQFLQDALQAQGLGPEQAYAHADRIEQTIFQNHQSEAGNDYRNSVRQLGLAIRQTTGPIISRLKQGSISPEDLATVDLQELASPERRQQNEQISRDNLQASLGAQVEPPNVEISENDQDVEAEMKSSGTTAHPELDLQTAI